MVGYGHPERRTQQLMRLTCALWMRATLPSQSTLSVDSSGRAVAQSITVCTPTKVAGMDAMSVRSP